MEENMINRLDLKCDITKIVDECQSIITEHGWGYKNQIGLNARIDALNQWHDSTGSLYDKIDKKFIANETDFSEWNLDENNYIRKQIELLQSVEGFKMGRIRIMRLHPHTGLSVHMDREVRFHMVLKTNRSAYFAFNNGVLVPDNVSKMGEFYHIPKDGSWYKVDTKKMHWVYNGGEEERIHLVVCGEEQ